MMKLFSNFRLRFYFLLFIIFAAAPLLWHSDINTYSFLGFADFLSPSHLDQNFYKRLFVYEPFMYSGIDFTFLIAQIVPVYLFFSIFETIGFSPSTTTLLFLFVILLTSEITMFYYLHYVLSNKIKIKAIPIHLLSFLGGVFYALSPYVIALIEPGQFIQLIIYATLPIILLIYDQILSEGKYDLKKFIYLFFIFFFSSAAFANIGMVYVLMILLGLYYLPLTIFNKTFVRSIPKYFLVSVTIFFSNIWWMLPFILKLQDTIKINQASDVLNTSLSIAVSKANIINLLLGRGESLLYLKTDGLPNAYYLSPILLFIFLLFIFFMFYGLLRIKQITYLSQLLFVAVTSLFITKGINEPFGNFFLFLYNYFPGFQIFRRPVSKFYWVFIFILITFAIIGAALLLQRVKVKWQKVSILLVLSFSCIYLWVIFILTPLLVPFNVPASYSDAKNYMQNQNVNKVLIIPGFYGTYPKYDRSFNNYYGSDFLTDIWGFSQLVPDSTSYSPNLLYKSEMNTIVNNIKKNQSFCQQSHDLGITHIVVREDINLQNRIEDDPKEIIARLDTSSAIQSEKSFLSNNKENFKVYQLKDTCAGEKIFTTNNLKANVQYTMMSPVKLKVAIKNFKENDTLDLLYNFSSSWVLYSDTNPPSNYDNKNSYQTTSFLSSFSDISLLAHTMYNNQAHFIVEKYANGWKLHVAALQKIGQVQKNADGTYNVNLIVYYFPQLYFYIGIILFTLVLIGSTIYIVTSYRKAHS